jgi:hypothetical protein
MKKIKHNKNIDTYWTAVNFKSDSGSRNTKLYICASYEYLRDEKKLNDMDKFMLKVADEWKAKGNSIFLKPCHFEIKAKTNEGIKNGKRFLAEIANKN